MPFIYNVTIGVDKDVADEWLAWMKSIHIPNVMKIGKFTGYKIYKVLSHDETEPTVSYAIQYLAATITHVQEYLDKNAPGLREELQLKFGSRVAAYRTLLEEV